MTANPPDYNYEPEYAPRWYKLKYRKPVLCSEGEGIAFMCAHKRRVRRTYTGEILVSTVFLCLDHGGTLTHPLLFETMSLDRDFQNQDCLRTHTWREALNNHWQIVNKVKDEHNTKRQN